jgi:hypothetical protein
MYSTYRQEGRGHIRMIVIIGITVFLFLWGLGNMDKKTGRQLGIWKAKIVSLFNQDGGYNKKVLKKKNARFQKAFRAADREIATLRKQT